ncbi:prepilin-type N-terminal cleavage/methylation domain-containing protein [Acinetobacter chinensis]|uniref:Prepilin-type N-terminal cleavage/methylation domain-containing protein n=1 Tax=Acinetobacter chinensis TaxID=2004650 RepID=A0A3B7M2I9_9GAMM|nr:prepilin-type N-terminal cleavage/methylation domain-containing protein [Acinetobacter chinensis]AXY58535.1 prepilin-type N-terminal cleavage/methylation domain-containing protein [Acinetobacter chinensis]
MSNTFKGFTLLELMVTLVIVAVLAAIAIPGYQYFIAKARKSQAQAEMLRLSERLESYRGKQLTYAGYIPENQNVGSGQKGVVNIPYGSTGVEYDYQLTVMDINPPDSAKPSLEDATVGQGWRILAVPNQRKSSALRKSESLLLDSRGVKCMTKDLLTTASKVCTHSEGW